jgi:hypothetical protein
MKFYSYYTENLQEQIKIDHQKVCNHLNIDVEYYIESAIEDYNTLYTSHGNFMTSVMEKEKIACFLDIDCLPYNKLSIEKAYQWAVENKSFVGNAQNISHTPIRNRLYAAASFLIVTQDVWNTLGKPQFSWFMQNEIQVDTAQVLSLRADEIGFPYQLMYPIGYDGDNPRSLGTYGTYGTGTLYPATWHYFRISEFKNQIPDLWNTRVNNILNNQKIIPNHSSCFYGL